MRNKEKYFKKEVNKADLVDYLVHTEGLTKYTANRIVNKLTEYIVINLGSFNTVKIAGLGTFDLNYTGARIGFVPYTKEKKMLRSKLKVNFHPEQTLKSLLQEQVTKFEEIFDLGVDKETGGGEAND